ncbi:MAG: Nif3-like dinuclear metal center hexameric protein [Oscillospiraceae bacterium]|jgi:dinuclear metal center YbgI/SA1388 family protein|nr:Nif3-like dinuclear metal center hexameric protein [Oscillospiraceae bacterium]
MPSVGDIYDAIDRFAPFSSQDSFDRCGLDVGSREQSVCGILTCLDVTPDIIRQAAQADANLIVCHHPLFFHAIQSISPESVVWKLIQAGISVISTHTPWDICAGGVNDCLASKLRLTNVRAIGSYIRIGDLPSEMSAEALCAYTAKCLNTPILYNGVPALCRTLALVGGAAGGDMPDAYSNGADAYLTGEARYHTFLESQTVRKPLLTAGHFETEHPSIAELTRRLQSAFPDLPIRQAEEKPPIHTILP